MEDFNSELEKREWAKLSFLWCEKNLKKSKFHENIPKLIIKKSKDKLKGYYKHSKNIICIYTGSHSDKRDLCETVIHEWKHYQQDISGMYNRYITKYKRNLKNHPYEITAERFAKKYTNKCYENIKPKNEI